VRTLHIGNTVETVFDRGDYDTARVHDILHDETFAVLGYGTQGRAQALNTRDAGLRVVVGARESGDSWARALADGWTAGRTLLPLDEAAHRGSVIAYLLSDAGQKGYWPSLRPHLTRGKALCFAHGFSLAFKDLTGVVPPADTDVFLIAPRGSGTTLRRRYQEGKGVSVSYAVHQGTSARALDRCLAIAFAIGAEYAYVTTVQREVFADLTGERGSLLGAIYGLWLAQYEVLREHGHSPAEAFLETVEEATQSLYPLIAEKGMDWMYANCSTTAQRGAVDWYKRFHDAAKPVFQELYDKVAAGDEARRALETNSRPDYRQQLDAELRAIAQSEMWQAGAAIRSLRT
jgi:ketol-acid reductoisomerase